MMRCFIAMAATAASASKLSLTQQQSTRGIAECTDTELVTRRFLHCLSAFSIHDRYLARGRWKQSTFSFLAQEGEIPNNLYCAEAEGRDRTDYPGTGIHCIVKDDWESGATDENGDVLCCLKNTPSKEDRLEKLEVAIEMQSNLLKVRQRAVAVLVVCAVCCEVLTNEMAFAFGLAMHELVLSRHPSSNKSRPPAHLWREAASSNRDYRPSR